MNGEVLYHMPHSVQESSKVSVRKAEQGGAGGRQGAVDKMVEDR